MSNLGVDKKRLRQLTIKLTETVILPLGEGAVVAPSTEGAPTRAPTAEEVVRVTAATLAPVVPKVPKVRVDLTILEKRNLCMALDARVDNKQHRVQIVAGIYKMDPSNVRRIYKQKAHWFSLYAQGLGKFQQIRKPRIHQELGYRASINHIDVLT